MPFVILLGTKSDEIAELSILFLFSFHNTDRNDCTIFNKFSFLSFPFDTLWAGEMKENCR